jgi:small redox-active disulfide protein 2
MIVKILGTGCARCQALEKATKEAVKDLGADVQIEHVTDIKKIMEYPIMSTPGLVIDENLVSSGRVLSKAEITNLITTAMSK